MLCFHWQNVISSAHFFPIMNDSNIMSWFSVTYSQYTNGNANGKLLCPQVSLRPLLKLALTGLQLAATSHNVTSKDLMKIITSYWLRPATAQSHHSLLDGLQLIDADINSELEPHGTDNASNKEARVTFMSFYLHFSEHLSFRWLYLQISISLREIISIPTVISFSLVRIHSTLASNNQETILNCINLINYWTKWSSFHLRLQFINMYEGHRHFYSLRR